VTALILTALHPRTTPDARMGPPAQLSDADLDRLAEIHSEDIERAEALWDSIVRRTMSRE
jgi:hypothetical protein